MTSKQPFQPHDKHAMPTSTHPLRITFLSPPANFGGGIRVISIYAHLLQKQGHHVRIVSQNHPKPSFIHQLKSILKGKKPSEKKTSHFDRLPLDHHILDSYRPIVDADVPDGDVVVATWWETAEWAAALSSSKGAKVYFIQHHEIHEYLPIERCRRSYTLPLHKIVIARWLLNVMRDEYHDTTVDLVPNSVDHAQFFAPERNKQPRPTVGFLNSPSAFKGVDITLQAIQKLATIFPNLQVISFGEHPIATTDAHLPDIEFHLHPPQDQIRHLYDQCDVWLTASRSEGFNLPAMEAMACRTPVISTRTGWPEEAIVDGYNGFLINIDDVDGMVNAATTLLSSDNQQWRHYSANAFATVEHSTWEASTDLFEQALHHAISRRDLSP
jgi:glycosyltransferase involved in cell wall biosynthesis